MGSKCRDCRYSTKIARNVYCVYLTITGKPRNCAAGDECDKYEKMIRENRRKPIVINPMSKEDRATENEYHAFEIERTSKK